MLQKNVTKKYVKNDLKRPKLDKANQVPLFF